MVGSTVLPTDVTYASLDDLTRRLATVSALTGILAA